MITKEITLNDFRHILKKIIKEQHEENTTKDDLIEYTVPDWAMSALINGDYSGLEDEEENKINEFVSDVGNEYGNANFMLGDVDGDDNLGFCQSNDIDNLASDCYRVYIKPDENQKKNII